MYFTRGALYIIPSFFFHKYSDMYAKQKKPRDHFDREVSFINTIYLTSAGFL